MTKRAASGLLLAGAIVVVLAGSASAHALIRSSDPASGAILQTAPTQVVVTFTEPPDPSLSFLHVLNSPGQSVTAGSSGPVPGNPLQLRVALKPLPNGVYTVVWRTVSEVDGHVTGNSFPFGVGVSSIPSSHPTSVQTPGTPSPRPLMVAGRWAFYWGLALLFGLTVVEPLVLRAPPPGWRALLVAGLALAVVGLGAMVLAEKQAVGVSLGTLLRSSAGRAYRDRAISLGAVAVAGILVLARHRVWTLAVLGAATAGAMLVHAHGGHAAATGSLSWFNVGVQWLHLLAVGIWIGGLAWLLLGLIRAPTDTRRVLGTLFARVAAVALGVVAVTGLSRALDEVGWPQHWGRLFTTGFGLTVLIKVGLFCVLVTLGAINHYVNVPAVAAGRKDPRVLRRTVTAEVTIAALILAATGVLSSLPPSASVAAAAARPASLQRVEVIGHDFASSVYVRLTVTPGTVGPNTFTADIRDFDTNQPVAATGVTLTFALPGRPELGTPSVTMHAAGPGLWTAQALTLSTFGRWNLTVLVQEATNAVAVPLQVTPRLAPETVASNSASGQPTLYTITFSGNDGSLQTYIDPGSAGANTVHFTFFTPSGSEQPITMASATSLSPAGQFAEIPLTRFDPGHFVANTQLAAGKWTFLINATTPDGRTLFGYFTQEVP
jgi:copper transport protein